LTRRLKFVLMGTLAAAIAGPLVPLVAARADPPGRAVYDGTCSRCHGPDGQEGKAPVLVPFRWNYAQALDIVRHGGACGMPAFSESDLSDEQLRQIVDYLKTLH
jgi:mono/diheme cytochrome c family protein